MEDNILTIMFVKQSGGKIRSVKLEMKKLFYLAVGIISLISAFILLIYSYYSIYQENSILIANIKNTNQYENEVVKSEPIENEPSNKSVEIVVEEQDEVSEVKNEIEGIRTESIENLNGSLTELFSVDTDSEKVTVSDFRVEENKDKPGIRVFFKLDNVNQVSRIEGYWILVGENKKDGEVYYRSHPRNLIDENGEILTSRRSTPSSISWFSIERFKIENAGLDFDNNFDDYNAIYIYIFSNKSELLLTSKFNSWMQTT